MFATVDALSGDVFVEESGNLLESATAVFDQGDRQYRYLLTRSWGPGPVVLFIMLNPSTADAFTDDPTVTRCLRPARRLGFGALAVVNLFALRATDPAALATHPEPVGPLNDAVITGIAAEADQLIAAWGAHPQAAVRAQVVTDLLNARRSQLACLGLTKRGQPRHPLYLRADSPLQPFPPHSTCARPARQPAKRR
ncbi:DUF1643 domain-containing protein [Amycolatopsis sp. YIM 10]|uniref:DUF1643 domain-containing protein n=1 Tax=Amycolatopsis sp. YIM 10 TaxID=2653857 RepID=UPI0012905E60|nr:DUF1643 domain-containing protein [Amycolatopsis sp. YIM 10]QFU90943.1 hypothetical protein YIM_28855 [Amycolatopsis sp. YIM 10]